MIQMARQWEEPFADIDDERLRALGRLATCFVFEGHTSARDDIREIIRRSTMEIYREEHET